MYVYLGPTTPVLPFQLNCPPDMATSILNDTLTVSSNLCGLPSINIPVDITALKTAFPDKKFDKQYNDNKITSNTIDQEGQLVPIGMQLIGKYQNEYILLKIALALEQRIQFNKMIPNWVTSHDNIT